eukprot:Rhum_TRINITY_DN15486_c1_g1::Rhum_TRINITY_DN15486_c1_g1_i1::g.159398::m.159398
MCGKDKDKLKVKTEKDAVVAGALCSEILDDTQPGEAKEQAKARWAAELDDNLRAAEQGVLPPLCRGSYHNLCRRGALCPNMHGVMDKRFDLGYIRGVVIPSPGSIYPWTDGSASIVLDDKLDAKYEPTAAEVLEYAEWIGMSVSTHGPLTWISKEGLQAPVLAPWRSCKTDTDEIYFFNFANGESSWDHPLDDHIRDLLTIEAGSLATRVAEARALAKCFRKHTGAPFPELLKYLLRFVCVPPYPIPSPPSPAPSSSS